MHAALFFNDHSTETSMEELEQLKGSGIWGYIGFAGTALIAGAMWFIGWLKKNRLDNAEMDARLDAIKNLQEMLAAERADHAAEVAALRQENQSMRERADKFAAERNDWMQKFGEVSGELRGVQQQLAAVQQELAALRAKSTTAAP